MNEKIDELKKKLEVYEKNFSTLIKNSPVPMAIYVNNKIYLINNAILKLFKAKSEKEIIGKNPLEFVLSEYHAIISNRCFQRISGEALKPYIVEAKDLEGNILKLLVNEADIIFDDKPAVLAQMIDITEREKAKEALKESENRLKTLINATPDIICFKDGEGRWLEANRADLELFQLQNIDYKGKTDLELANYTHSIYKEAFLTCRKSDEKAWEKGSLLRTEEIIPKPDGEVKVYDIIKVPVFNDDGSKRGLIVIGRDITKLKLQLKFSECLNEFAEFIIKESNLDSILVKALEIVGKSLKADFTKIYKVNLNDKYISILKKWKNPDFPHHNVGKDYYDLSKFENSNRYALENPGRYIISSIDNPNPLIMKDNLYNMMHIEYKIKTFMWFPLKFQTDDYYLLTIYHIKNIHKWNNIEINFLRSIANLIELAFIKLGLIEDYKKLATVVEQSKNIILITDASGKIIYVNKAFEELTGYFKDEVLNKPPKFLKSEKHEISFYKDIVKQFSSGKSWYGKMYVRKKDGTEYLEEAVIFPIKDDKGKIINFCKISRDVTKEKELEEQLIQAQKMEAIGRLAGGIAHDFNNILTVINGYAEIAKLKLENSHPVLPYIEHIYNAGLKAQNLVNQILAFSRKQVYSPEIVSINKVIIDSLEMCKRLIPEDINIELHLKDNLPEIKADKHQIEQILINLIVNSRDALQEISLPDFKKRIKISTDIEDPPDYLNYNREKNYIVISVSDNGKGIPNEIKDKIFEPFFTTKPKDRGTGLGLSVVYGIVKQNNGFIICNSEFGKGAEFKIYWPAIEKNIEGKNGEERKKDLLENLKGRGTILVVEDNEDVLSFIKDSLERLGYTVFTSRNGEEALTLISEKNIKFDLIISDVVMPKKDGFQLFKEIQKILPDSKFLFMSGYDHDILTKNGKIQKNFNFIQKPFDIKTLSSTIKKILKIN